MYAQLIPPSRDTLIANVSICAVRTAIRLQVEYQQKKVDFYEEKVKEAEANQLQVKNSYPEDTPDDPTMEQLISNKYNSYQASVENALNQAKQNRNTAKTMVVDLERWDRFMAEVEGDGCLTVPLTFKDMEYFKL